MARQSWNPENLPDLTGRRYLVTGSNAGLGYFSAEHLARAGAHVIMSGRSPNRLSAARTALQSRIPDASVETILLDLSNRGSVRAAAASVRSHKRLDGVLLNAGIVHPPKERRTTVDGDELVFATNVLGHFALAAELLTVLSAGQGRMVWLGSISTSLWSYDLDDPQLRENYTGWRAYVQSKLASTVLGVEAARRLEEHGVPVKSVIAHPGYSTGGRTEGIHGVNEPTRRKRFSANLQAAITQSKDRGAWPLVRALADPYVESGELWGPRFKTRGEPRKAELSKEAVDPELGERVWEICEKTTAAKWPFDKAAKVRRRFFGG